MVNWFALELFMQSFCFYIHIVVLSYVICRIDAFSHQTKKAMENCQRTICFFLWNPLWIIPCLKPNTILILVWTQIKILDVNSLCSVSKENVKMIKYFLMKNKTFALTMHIRSNNINAALRDSKSAWLLKNNYFTI